MKALRFAALGDSLTEGVGDPVGGAWRGWAALLAEGLAPAEVPVDFRNFAVGGAQTSDVLLRQLPRALAFTPDVASVVIGVNDTLRAAFDIRAVAAHLDAVYGAFAERGCVLLTACLPDPGTLLGLPGVLARPLARRQRAVNSVIHALSERHGAVHLHAADAHWAADRALWSADRLHPGERGHRQFAARFHAVLAAAGEALGPAPDVEPERPAPTRAGRPVVARHGGHRLGREALRRPAARAPGARRGRGAARHARHRRPSRPAGLCGSRGGARLGPGSGGVAGSGSGGAGALGSGGANGLGSGAAASGLRSCDGSRGSGSGYEPAVRGLPLTGSRPRIAYAP